MKSIVMQKYFIVLSSNMVYVAGVYCIKSDIEFSMQSRPWSCNILIYV